MAGIGFELRRLAREDNLSSAAMAFFGAAVVTAGPWFLTVLALTAIHLAQPVIGQANLARFQIITIYDFAASLVVVGPISITANRYLADRLFARDATAAPGLLVGALSLAVAVQAAVGVPFWLSVGEFPIEERLLALAEFFLIGGVWVVVVFMTALKRHAAVVAAFAIGMIIGTGSAILLAEEFGVIGLLSGFVAGIAWVLCSLIAQIFAEYPYPVSRPFAFLGHFRTYWELPLSAFAWNLGIWIDKLALWTGPEYTLEAGLRSFPTYDSAMFLANLLMVPGMAVFLIAVETRFYEDYLRFFRDIVEGATLRRIEEDHHRLGEGFGRNFHDIALVQTLVCVLAIVLAPNILPLFGAPMAELGIFRLGALGSLFQAIILFLTITLSYFDLRRRVLTIQLIFVGLNGAFSLASIRFGFSWYGYGYFLACLITCLIAFALTAGGLRRLPYLAFIGNNPTLR